jgi:hypothetical protein
MGRDTKKFAKEAFIFMYVLILNLFGVLALSSAAAAQKQLSEEELAKQTQNPVADLISVPLQNNFNFRAGFRYLRKGLRQWRQNALAKHRRRTRDKTVKRRGSGLRSGSFRPATKESWSGA